MNRNVARVVDLHKSFGENRVLTGVSVAFPANSCTFIAGPSGTGKSVLVRHLVGLLKPDSGEVYYDDQRVDPMTEAQLLQVRKRCLYVFQHPTLFDSMSVLENISLVLRFNMALSKREADEMAEAQLQALGLAHRLHTSPGHLPQGEQKLVSVARALALKPETLILDEPTTGLDPFAAEQLDGVCATLSGAGRTLLIISHDLQSIRRLASQVIFMHRGKLHFQGTPEQFFGSADPILSGFTAGDPATPL